MLDRLNYTPTESVSIHTVSAQRLAKANWSKAERKELAALYMTGRLKIEQPTKRFAASLFNISPNSRRPRARRAFRRSA